MAIKLKFFKMQNSFFWVAGNMRTKLRNVILNKQPADKVKDIFFFSANRFREISINGKHNISVAIFPVNTKIHHIGLYPCLCSVCLSLSHSLPLSLKLKLRHNPMTYTQHTHICTYL